MIIGSETLSARRCIGGLYAAVATLVAAVGALTPAPAAGWPADPRNSLLAQRPLFSVLAVPPNVVLVMDNSTSMLTGRLPKNIPTSIQAEIDAFDSTKGCVSSPTRICDKLFLRYFPAPGRPNETLVEVKFADFDSTPELQLASWFNPLAFVPSVSSPGVGTTDLTWPTWNYDGVRFPEADPQDEPVADSDGFLRGTTPHDPRFAGRNEANDANPVSGGQVVYSNDGALSRLTGATGANARVLRIDGKVDAPGFFSGASKTSGGQTVNQSLFRRTLVQSRTVSECSVPDGTWSYPAIPNATEQYCRVLATPPTPTVASWTVTCPATGATRTESTFATPAVCGFGGEGFVLEIWTPNNPTCASGTLFGGQCCQTIDTRPVNIPERPCGGLECCTNRPASLGGPVALTSRISCPAPVTQATCTANGVGHWYESDNQLTVARYVGAPSSVATGGVARLTASVIELNRSGFGGTQRLEQARRYARWYTYYRTRLFGAIGAASEALTGLNSQSGLDELRIGYGAINHFAGGMDPYQFSNPWGPVPPNQSPPTFSSSLAAADAANGDSGFVDNLGTIVRGVRSFAQGSDDNKKRREVFNWLFSLRAAGSTPNREAVDSVGRYFARADRIGPYAQSPGVQPGQAANQQTSCRRNFMVLVTDGEWTKVPSSGGGVSANFTVQPRLEDNGRAASLPASIDSTGSLTPLNAMSDLTKPSIAGGGTQTGNSFPPAGSDPQPQFRTVTGSPTGTFADAAYFWWSRDLRNDLVNNITPRPETDLLWGNESFWQNLTTYSVGFGISAPADTATRRASVVAGAAITWEGVDTGDARIQDIDCGSGSGNGCGRRSDTFRGSLAARGDFLSAGTAAELANRLTSVFNAIAPERGSGSPLVATNSRVTSGDRVYVASFNTGSWDGEVVAYDALAWLAAVRAGTVEPAPLWRATQALPAPDSRKLFIGTKSLTSASPLVVYELKFGGGAGQIPSTAFGIVPTQDQVAYWRGDQSMEAPNGPFRARASLLGDIVNSAPLFSKAPNFGYGPSQVPSATTPAQAAAYPTYVRNNVANRTGALYVGANDGFLHAFRASDGVELFGYAPAGNRLLRRGTAPRLFTYRPEAHIYSVDGPVVHGDVYINGAWRTVIVGSTGAGGADASNPPPAVTFVDGSVFALDVTDPTAFGVGSVLWDNVRDASGDQGLVTTPGVIGSVKHVGGGGGWYYVVGNGTESRNDRARLLLIDIASGAITSLGRSVDETADSAASPNGLYGVTPVFEQSTGDIVAVYAGDRKGRLWKWDLSGGIAAGATAGNPQGRLLFDTGGQPIFAAPYVTDHPLGGRAIVFGTGRLNELNDRTDTGTQSIYGLWERDPSSPVEIAKTRLRQLTLSNQTSTSGPTFRALSGLADIVYTGNSPNLGWYFDLNLTAGERVIAAPEDDLGFVRIATFSLENAVDPCTGGGQSFLYRLSPTGRQLGQAVDPFVCTGCNINTVGVSIQGTTRVPIPLASRSDSGVSTRTLTEAQLKQLLANRNTAKPNSGTLGCGVGVGGGGTCPEVTTNYPSHLLRTWRPLPVGVQ